MGQQDPLMTYVDKRLSVANPIFYGTPQQELTIIKNKLRDIVKEIDGLKPVSIEDAVASIRKMII